VVDGVLEDVLDGVVVLLLRFDQLRPEAPAEDVVAASVALVEAPGVAAVEVAHAIGEVRHRRLDDQVIVVAEEAAHVDAPAVPPRDPPQDVEEEDSVPVVQHDRRLVIAARREVVVRAGGKVTAFSAHPRDGSGGRRFQWTPRTICHRSAAAPSRARHRTGLRGL
jgi:hypothetical protein